MIRNLLNDLGPIRPGVSGVSAPRPRTNDVYAPVRESKPVPFSFAPPLGTNVTLTRTLWPDGGDSPRASLLSPPPA